ncbi:MAG: type II secretion system GspH family protein [Oscillospiraceae bacterium]|nr:type II secretion system GspH family protein [Oscillospiraceae bacterium]
MNNGRSKSGLFLIELLVVITVFALCAAFCVRIFTSAYLAGIKSRDVSRALNIAKSAAEAYKVTGDAARSASLAAGEDQFTVYFTPVEDAPVPTCVISVVLDEEELVSITAASRVRGERNG